MWAFHESVSSTWTPRHLELLTLSIECPSRHMCGSLGSTEIFCLVPVNRHLRPWQTRTHFCGHIVADTNVSPFARARNICCEHKFCVPETKKCFWFCSETFSVQNKCFPSCAKFCVLRVCAPKKHHKQQCVRNYVSSFARAFSLEDIKT